MLMLTISMRPFWTRIHLRRRRRRVALVLRHLMTLRLIGRVGRGVGRAGGRDGGIYRNAGVRLHVRVVAMAIVLPIMMEGGGHGRTCCLSHTCRTTGLGAGRVVVLRRASEVLGVGGGARGGRLTQTVVRLRRVGGGNIGGGAHVGLRRVLRVGADLRLGGRGVLSSGCSRSLVCSREFRMGRGRRCIWKMRT